MPALKRRHLRGETGLLVANRDAGNVGAPQRLADRFGLIALETGETGPE
jgi:hypothetical protein